MSGIRWPVKGTVSQGFGRPANRVEPTMYLQIDAGGDRKCRPARFTGGVEFNDVHPGVDIVCPVGTAIVAPEKGILLRRETYRIWNPFVSAYVWGLSIYFGFGNAIMYVDHLSKYVAAENQHVARGALIGRTGNSGVSTGPHAHVEIRQSSDPHVSWAAYRWNPERLREGGDLAGLPFIKP